MGSIKKGGCVYIITNQNHTTFYVGVTSSLRKRKYEHREKLFDNSFTARYNLNKLVYHEAFSTIEEAISREKRIKGGSRAKKETLIISTNPEYNDLWEEIQDFFD